MATEELRTRTARISLENGTDSDGNMKYVKDNLRYLSNNASDWDADKFLNIVAAWSNCVSKTLAGAETVATYSVTKS